MRQTPGTAVFVSALAALALTAGCAVSQGPATHPAEGDPATAEAPSEQPAPETEPFEAPPAEQAPSDLDNERMLAVEWPVLEDLDDLDDEYLFGEPITESPLDELAEAEPELTPEQLEQERDLVAAQAPTFDIPMDVNEKVLAWVDRYSNDHKRSFEIALARSGRYIDMFRAIFAEQGLPQDLVYMAHVESGYKTSAYSRAHARGIFQFISSTARLYGLRVDYWVDERADPEKSARAAAAYMEKLYGDFGDWYLAIAAYNAGEGKIKRALARSGHDDFWGIAETRYIRRETKNHVPAILAAILLSKQPDKYGLENAPETAIEYESFEVEGAADLRILAECAGTDLETMRTLNPALRRYQTPPDGKTDVRVPVGSAETARASLGQIPRSERVLYARHKVRKGETLSEIAGAYGVSVRAIQSTNGMGRRTLIRVNQELRIPTSSGNRFAGYAALPANEGDGEVLAYRVRSGDTLYGISRRYRTTPAAIAAASDISVHKTLQIGERLRVVPGIRSSSSARRIALGGSAGAAIASSGSTVHTVRRGDTLWDIAVRYNTSVSRLCSWNEISPRSTLHPGAKLRVSAN